MSWTEYDANTKWEIEALKLNTIVQLTETELELFENGICLNCGEDDVECNYDCTEHKCLACEYIPEVELKGRKIGD